MPTRYHKTSISLAPEIAKLAEERAKELGFENSFSAYIQKLIREDLEREATSTTAPSKPVAPPTSSRADKHSAKRIRSILKSSREGPKH